jgi:hypothetical protein
MTTEALGTYLNDHLAGSLAAVEMVERAIEENRGDPLATSLAEVVAAIREDQAVLRRLLERLGVSESPLKKAGAWLAEKAGRLKLGDTGDGPLPRFEMLEALSLGILGKLALWRALQRIADRYPAVAELDLMTLERRAREQHERVEAHRLEAAAGAL